MPNCVPSCVPNCVPSCVPSCVPTCMPNLFVSRYNQICNICSKNCSLFEIKIINNEQPVCNSCYTLIEKANLNPENKKAFMYPEKYKLYIKNDMYSVRGNYVINKWNIIIGDIINKKVQFRVFIDMPCFLCKGNVSLNNECYIDGYLYHYECSLLCV